MHTINIIYLTCGTLLIFDLLYIMFNFRYCYELYLKERASYHVDTNTATKKILSHEIVKEIGVIRTLVKTIVYWIWFVVGLFTPFWFYHIILFVFNFLFELINGAKINITPLAFLFKVLTFLIIYLIIVIKLFHI